MTLGLALGLIFGPLAGAMAFLITYEEYQHHVLDRRRAFRASLHVGVTTFVVLLVLSTIGGILMGQAVP
jgi:hypothetical protein